jgi:tetratricopeptide (TPR) repeat protein
MSLFGAGLLAGTLISILSVLMFEAGRHTGGVKTRPFALPSWRGTTTRGTIIILAACCALTALALSANFPGSDVAPENQAPDRVEVGPQRADVSGMDAEVTRIEKYLASVGRTAPAREASAPQSQAGGLPDVETMIASLAKRLEAQPGDVEGWRTLGWSYLNTGRPAEALKAYEKAIEIAPDRQDLKEGLETARAATRGGSEMPADPATAVQVGNSGSN